MSKKLLVNFGKGLTLWICDCCPGIKVIDLTTYAAGQACTRVLSDWGAEVIKVEPLSGEAYRFFGKL